MIHVIIVANQCATDGQELRVKLHGVGKDRLESGSLAASTQACGSQSPHQFTTFHGLCSDGNGLLAQVLGKVVVITIETTGGNCQPRGKGVQFIQRVVAHEVTPHAPMVRPVRVVDENGHDAKYVRWVGYRLVAAPVSRPAGPTRSEEHTV